jgi:hypothetical protein
MGHQNLCIIIPKNRHVKAMSTEDHSHEVIFTPDALVLGRLHYAILRAGNLMSSARFETAKEHGGLATYKTTAFGKEVGMDEIHWWIFKKEKEIAFLRELTELALKAADTLKASSAKLRKNEPGSYQELLLSLKTFAEEHAVEVSALNEYVGWLERKDPLAPVILFTYRVWGSTQMSDRWIHLPPDASKEDVKIIQECTEIVLGLSSRRYATYAYVYSEINYEIYESMEEEAFDREIVVPEGRVVSRTARRAYEECAIYFSELRASLRNILIDIDKAQEQQTLIGSDAFWRNFVLKAVQAKKTETQLWDFKETLTIWHVKQQPEKERAKVTFAEDIASFANARGGVLVVGVNNQREIVGLGDDRDVESRLKVARDVITERLVYDRDIVRFQQVVIEAKGLKMLCLIVIVAQAYNVVGVRDNEGRYSYPLRNETGIKRVADSDIANPKAGMKADNYDFIVELRQFVKEG